MAGDIKYKDINNDGLVDNRDFVPIGHPTTRKLFMVLVSHWVGKILTSTASSKDQPTRLSLLMPGLSPVRTTGKCSGKR